MEVVFFGANLFRYLPFSRYECLKIVENLCVHAQIKNIELCLVRDAEIYRLNAMYMGCRGITNILSFPTEEQGVSGSLVISVDTGNREVFLYKQDPRIYYIMLFIHGICHILGYEHGEKMSRFSKELLEAVL